MIILVGGEKGGTGKSMISCNISVFLATQGRDVMLLDADPQGTASKWVNRRNENYPDLPKIHCVQKSGDIFQTIRDLADRYEEVIIDAGGRDSIELRTALVTSQKLLTPLQPAQDNLETIPKMLELVNQAKAMNRDLQSYILINRANTNPQVKTAELAIEMLGSEQNSFTILADCKINDYKIFQDANSAGVGVIETSHTKAIEQITALCRFLYGDISVTNKEASYA